MCTPTLILGVALSAAQAGVSFAGAQAQADAQQDQYEANQKAARLAAANRYASQQTRIIQEEAAASQKKQNVALKAQAARSTARVAAGEAGVTGLSVDALMQDFAAQEGRYTSAVDQNYAMTENYLRGEMEATQDQAVARINAVPPPVEPSFASGLVNIFSSGVNAFAQYQKDLERAA